MSTRRVEWSIPASHFEATTGKLLSPKFEAGGSHDLQIELLPKPRDKSSEGDFALKLHAKDGLFLMCKVHVGFATMQVEHSFDAGPCSLRPFCFVRDHLESDSLTISLEILEAVRHVSQELWPAVLAELPSPPSPSPLASQLLPSSDDAEDVAGSIMSHRYLIHRTLELVEKQVDIMRSRMVRQVEWRLEKASQLRKCFPEGEPVCSATFEAAGLEGLQLVFYPSGCKGAREGFCSYFLQIPSGCSLKCWLAAGKQRREACSKLSFERPGYFGRTNFCRFDFCIDTSDDSILLALDIEEAEQTVTESLRHQLGVHESAPFPLPLGHGEAGPSQLAADSVDSSMRLRRTPGKSGLEDVRQLPSIWTTRPMGDVAGELEGYRTFHDLKAARRPNSSRRHYSGSPWKSEVSVSALQHTTSQLAQKYLMYAA